MTEERWLPVPDYEGLYEVSDHGRVRRIGFRGHMMKQCGQRGYVSVGLWKGGKLRTCRVNRLVLLSFVGPPPPKHESAHWDNVRSNNRLDNLRWATRKDNHADKHRHGTRQCGERCGRAKLTEKKVQSIRQKHQPSKRGSLTRLAEEYGVTPGAIAAIIERKTWHHV